MTQLPTVPNGYYKMLNYSNVLDYKIYIKDIITREEIIGSTKRVHELFTSSNYSNQLFYITTDFNNNPQKPDFGKIRQKNLAYRNIDSNMMEEVNYILLHKKDTCYTFKNLNMIFNNSLIGEFS